MYVSARVGFGNYKEFVVSESGIEFMPCGLVINRSQIQSLTTTKTSDGGASFRLRVSEKRYLFLIGTIHWVNEHVTFGN